MGARLFPMLTACYLTLRWDTLPGRWVSPLTVLGVPHGWVQRSVVSAFSPSILAFVLSLVCGAIMDRLPRLTEGHPWRTPLVEATQHVSSNTALTGSLLLGALGLIPVMGTGFPRWAVCLSFLIAVLVLSVDGFLRVTAAVRRMQADPGAPDLTGYRSIFYAKALDERVWVPELLGVGYTLNFARPQAWLLLAGMLVGSLVITLTILCGLAHI
jgi:uncharacterized membrane protein